MCLLTLTHFRKTNMPGEDRHKPSILISQGRNIFRPQFPLQLWYFQELLPITHRVHLQRSPVTWCVHKISRSPLRRSYWFLAHCVGVRARRYAFLKERLSSRKCLPRWSFARSPLASLIHSLCTRTWKGFLEISISVSRNDFSACYGCVPCDSLRNRWHRYVCTIEDDLCHYERFWYHMPRRFFFVRFNA